MTVGIRMIRLGLCAGAALLAAPPAFALGLADLTGEWNCTADCREPNGKAKIYEDPMSHGPVDILVNEAGTACQGGMRHLATIVCPSWGSLRGSVSGDGQTIRWENGTVWQKADDKGSEPPPASWRGPQP
jgi:hypothetical protein